MIGDVFGTQPRIADGVRGEALVLTSVAGPVVRSGSNEIEGTSGYQRRWEARIPLLVRIPGREPYWLAPRRWMSRAKYPIGGTTVPVTVDRDDPSRVRIEWDEVPEIDEWIASGHPVFTDPDSVRAQLRDALAAYQTAAVNQAIGHALDAMGPDAAVERDAVQTAVKQAREAVDPPRRDVAAIDGPSARILALTPGVAVGFDTTWRGEMLLSVAVPGATRYGLRWKGKIDGTRYAPPWGDVSVHVDAAGKLDVLWERLPTVVGVATDKARALGERLEAELAAPSKWETSMPAAVRPDPLDQLRRLGELRDAGALTDAEFAAEKARVLGKM